MELQMDIKKEGNGLRLKTKCEAEMNGEIQLDLHIPLVNPDLITLQVVALEQAAAALSKRAQQLRALIPSTQTP